MNTEWDKISFDTIGCKFLCGLPRVSPPLRGELLRIAEKSPQGQGLVFVCKKAGDGSEPDVLPQLRPIWAVCPEDLLRIAA